MVVAAFVAPYLLDTTTRFVEAAARLPGYPVILPKVSKPAEIYL